MYTGQGVPLSLHSMNLNDDSSVLMKNNIAGFRPGVPQSYDPATDMLGHCLDSENRRYSVGRLKEYDYNVGEQFTKIKLCLTDCEELSSFADQVGVELELRGLSKLICSCLYTYDKGPQYINRLGSGPVAGSGDMKPSDDANKFGCYINQVSATNHFIICYCHRQNVTPYSFVPPP